MPGARFLSGFWKKKRKKTKKLWFCPISARFRAHMTEGNAALAVSTAAESFTNMVRMAQSMVAVKTAAKSDVRFITGSFLRFAVCCSGELYSIIRWRRARFLSRKLEICPKIFEKKALAFSFMRDIV